MPRGTSCKEAITSFEAVKGVVAATSDKAYDGHAVQGASYQQDGKQDACRVGSGETDAGVDLAGVSPPIEKMDAALGNLKVCRHLALSTNSIEKIASLAGMEALQILSLGRNLIRRIEGLDPVAETLEQLWLSYNQLERLTGLEKLPKLRVLFVSNNKVKDWPEVERLAALPALEELLLVGNPLHADFKDRGTLPEFRLEVLRRLPKLKKLDGQAIDPEEREAAAAKKA